MRDRQIDMKFISRLFPDSVGVIKDTPISTLSKGAQAIYLAGGYHTLVNRLTSDFKSVNQLDNREEMFFRQRLARDLVLKSQDYHKDKQSVIELLNYLNSLKIGNIFPALAESADKISSDYFSDNDYIDIPQLTV